jgi:hypothetical protein
MSVAAEAPRLFQSFADLTAQSDTGNENEVLGERVDTDELWREIRPLTKAWAQDDE